MIEKKVLKRANECDKYFGVIQLVAQCKGKNKKYFGCDYFRTPLSCQL